MTPIQVPDRLGHYRIERELGRGGMGVVYLAQDEQLGRQVALKVVRTQELVDETALRQARARFRREARLAAKLLHPNVVTLFAYHEFGDLDVIAMEYVQGVTLDTILATGRVFSVDEATGLMVQVGSGVAAAHQIGTVHCDLKPGNIVVMPDGRAKVLDFGIAKSLVSARHTS